MNFGKACKRLLLSRNVENGQDSSTGMQYLQQVKDQQTCTLQTTKESNNTNRGIELNSNKFYSQVTKIQRTIYKCSIQCHLGNCIQTHQV